MVVSMHQVPMSPAFALTEYKVQGSTYTNAVLDLRRLSKGHGQTTPHRQYYSVYVQLSRLRSLKGLWLLQPVSLRDINNKVDPMLCEEDRRLQELAAATMRSN